MGPQGLVNNTPTRDADKVGPSGIPRKKIEMADLFLV